MHRRRGPVDRLLAALGAQTLRIVGLVTAGLAGSVIAASLTTEYVPGDPQSGATAATLTANADALAVLLQFSLAHPAYPAAVLFGLALLVLGDDAPLLGS